MTHLILNADQTRLLEQAVGVVEIRDEGGRVLARLPAPSEELIEERCRQNPSATQPRYPAEQVEARFRRLEEIRQQRGMDEATLRDLLRRMRAGEAV